MQRSHEWQVARKGITPIELATLKKTERLTTAFLGERIKLWFNHGDHGGLTFSQMHRQIEGNSSIVF